MGPSISAGWKVKKYDADRGFYRRAIPAKPAEPPIPQVNTPIYRYLKEGEVIQEGDEWDGIGGYWKPTSIFGMYINKAEEMLKCYRRKVDFEFLNLSKADSCVPTPGVTGEPNLSVSNHRHPAPDQIIIDGLSYCTEDVRLAKLCRDKYYWIQGNSAPDAWETVPDSVKRFWLDYYKAAKATISRDSIRDGWSNK